MTDATLTLRRTDPERESYAVGYDHPDFGKIEVGRVAEREGNPIWTDAWAWSIGYSTLPASRWRQGSAPTRKAAEVTWKHNWPGFRAAITEAEWHDAKAAQDHSAKTIMIYDARKLSGLTAEQHQALTRELNRAGPAPNWLRELLTHPGRSARDR